MSVTYCILAAAVALVLVFFAGFLDEFPRRRP